jgi:DNA adenine methylase
MNEILEDKNIDVRPRPFIKWAGGKKWLTARIIDFLPSTFNNYHEPFLGGAAVFFYVRPLNQVFLSDLNSEVINAFNQIKEDPLKVISQIDILENNEVNYYNVRANISTDKISNAARFIFLNKTCYNGIYRVNKKGKFNVPYGHNKFVTIYERDNLFAASKALINASIKCQDFEKCLVNIEKGDLVFLDPPYTVAHNNNGFLEYNQKIFTWNDQKRLADFVNEIKNKKAYFLLTNGVHKCIVKLYGKLGKRYELDRYSTITSRIGKRKKISEYLFTNCV